MMAHEVKLGELIDETQQRDAIHIAIAPVIAALGEMLHPGQDIGFVFTNDTVYVGSCSTPIGIVDPFLKKRVYQGDRFWMWLYPNTITSLRHDWTHPAFEAKSTRTIIAPVSESHLWLQNYANKICVRLDVLLERAKEFLEYGSYWSEGDRFEGTYLPEEFWRHYEIVTGEKVPEGKRDSFFSCAC